MVYFGRSFASSTFLFLLLFKAVSLCKKLQYNSNVFEPSPILFKIDICEKTCPVGNYFCHGCSEYVCKINTTFYFGYGCKKNVINFCQPGTNSNEDSAIEIGQSIVHDYNDVPRSFRWYQKYTGEVRSFGNDSMQERFFWLELLALMNLPVDNDQAYFWKEKATDYILMNLQNYINEIQNSELNVKKKAKVIETQTESIFRDLQGVQKAANQSLPESKYFQQKYAEIEAKMEVIKQNDNILKSYIIKSNETLFNVATEMNNSHIPTDVSQFQECQRIQEKILQAVKSNKKKVMDLLKFANETVKNFSYVNNDEITDFQSVGHLARKAMKNFEIEKEMKDLMKEVKEAAEDVKKIGEAAQKTAEVSKTTAYSAGKNAEALNSNGGKSGEFEVAFILSFLALPFLI